MFTVCAINLVAAANISATISGISVFSNYRQDSGSFTLCSTLSDGQSIGYGKLRVRQAHICQLGLAVQAELTSRLSLELSADWGSVLGGNIRDSGVSDIISNPWNAVSEDYASCCLCSCKVDTCDCDCQGIPSRSMVPVNAALGGNVWDVTVELDYHFNLSDQTKLYPTCGLAFNHQRSKLKHSTWGPIRTEITPVSCEVKSPFDLGFQKATESDDLLVKVKNTDGSERYLLLDSITYAQEVAGSFFPVIPLTELENVSCVQFGSCFDSSVYKVGWNGIFAGLGMRHSWNKRFSFDLLYKLYLQMCNGSYTTFGGRQLKGCIANNCPQFVVNDHLFQADPASNVTRRSFAPDDIHFSSLSYGQDIFASADVSCDDLKFGIFGLLGYRYAPGCKSITPCQSCNTIVNGGLAINGNTELPIWSDATTRSIRWSTLSVGVFARYLY